MNDNISIIIPVYNVESYIRKCLDSVINQTYKNLEIILINDGSTDNSGKICDEYAAKDNRIRVIHKENGGLSSALNVGLKNSTGDYIGFIDSDDLAEPRMYEEMLRAIKSENVQISVSNYYRDTDSESIPVVNKELVQGGVIDTDDMLLYSLKRDYYTGFCGYVWNKLYRADIIRTNNIRFEEKINFGMDALFFTKVVIAGKCNGTYIDKPLYHYYQRTSSISNKNPTGNRNDAFFVYQSIIDLLDANGYKDVSIWAKRFYCYFASMYAEISIKNDGGKILPEMQKEMKLYLEEYIETNKEFPDRIERINNLLGEACLYG